MKRFCAGSLHLSIALLLACSNNDPGTGEETSTETSTTETGEPEPPSLTIFASSAVWDGNLGGVQGADQKCQGLADAAGLDGVFSAWVSADGFGVSVRLTHSSDRYALTNGDVIALNWDDLVDGQIEVAIGIDENGEAIDVEEQSAVWTATDQNGSFFGPDCGGWMSATAEDFGLVGDVEITSAGWSSIGSLSCATQRHLYCIEQ